ncbi:MAG: DUF2079 domain-containing protein [Ktedonobacterales bacterium]
MAERGLAVLRWIGVVLRLPYVALPPAPRGRWPRVAIGIVTLMAVAFIAFFTAYAGAQFDAYLTNAEDLGIMDQALWNTVHGAMLHQTICNPISDANCLGDVSRFAIHFEPLMLPLALLYLVAATPKALILIQMIVVASGAYPAYLIASRRLSSPLAGICFAAVYLTFPALQSAVQFDFHAVTLSSTFLLFALYYMLSYNNLGLFIAVILAMATKEEVPLDVLMIGLAIVCYQRRWRIGVALIVLACCWLGFAELVMHLTSPLGHSPTAGRYAYLGKKPIDVVLFVLTHPLQLLRDQIIGNGGARYLQTLLTPVAYLAILAPMAWILAAPPLLINLLSSDPNMHQGIHQYSAEIVPFMLFAAISAVALLVAGVEGIESSAPFARLKSAAVRVLSARWQRIGYRARDLPGTIARLRIARVVLLVVLLLIVTFSARQQHRLSNLPVTDAFIWPQVTAHTRIADALLTRIPATASVSAQDTLVPHLSHRRFIYQYPDGADKADYVFLDTSTTVIYPFTDKDTYTASVQKLLTSGQMTIIAQQDGYLLLVRNR